MVWSDFVVSSSSQRCASRSASMRTAARFGSHRPHRGRSFALTLDYLSASIRRRRRPGNDQDAILIVSRRSLGKLDLDRRTRDHDALNGGSQVGVVVDGAQARRKIGWRTGADRSSWTALPSN